MPFVYENINAVRAQEILACVRHPVVQFQRLQVIDRKRDMVLARLGGHGDQPKIRGELPNYFNLLWRGIPIAFEGYEQQHFLEPDVQVDVDIVKMEVPHTLQDSVAEIQQAVVEALECYWDHRTWSHRYRPQHASVRVQFPTVQFY